MHERDVGTLAASDITAHLANIRVMQQLQTFAQRLGEFAQANSFLAHALDLLIQTLQRCQASQPRMRGAMVIPHGGFQQFFKLVHRDHQLQVLGRLTQAF